jgi:small ligand-binding sensory domain FIST
MLWAASHATLGDPSSAAAQAAADVRARLGEGAVDLALAFFTARLAAEPETLAATLRSALRPGCLIGCSAGSVIATDRELEGGSALTLIAARLPGVEAKPFILVGQSWGEAIEDPLEFARHTPGIAGTELTVLLGDPFSLDVERVLHAFNRHAPGLRMVGGMASAGTRPNANTLILNDWVAHEGGVAVALRGGLRADVVVSQGCRPVGPPLEVTRAEQNVILELDGQPALERAEQVLRGLPAEERAHLRQGLYVGRPAKGGAAGTGDYLIRNLLGADRDRGALAVGDRIAERERLRLHVRDARSAREDLELLLSPQVVDTRASAALLFSCNGRGRAFFGEPHRDVTALQGALGGGVPTAGFFCAGEVGPVAGRNYLHGHTASIAILRPR